jgi:hypothetical protein
MTGRAIFTDSDEARWFRDAPDDSDDLLPPSHPAMREAFARWQAAVDADAARLTDDQLVAHSADQRRFGRASA